MLCIQQEDDKITGLWGYPQLRAAWKWAKMLEKRKYKKSIKSYLKKFLRKSLQFLLQFCNSWRQSLAVLVLMVQELSDYDQRILYKRLFQVEVNLQ